MVRARNIGISLRRFTLAERFVFALLLASAPVSAVLGQASRSIAPETVVVPSGKLRLRGYLWKPAGSAPRLPSCSLTVRPAPIPRIVADSRFPREPKDWHPSLGNAATPST